MTIADHLNQLADELVANLEQRQAALEAELKQLRGKVLQRENELAMLRSGRGRRLEFQPLRGHDLTCPGCWIDRGIQAVLKPGSLGTDTEEFLRCVVCHQEFEIPD